MLDKRLISDWFQIIGFIGSSLVLLTTLVLLILFKAYRLFPLPIFIIIVITNLSALIGYIYYQRYKQTSLILIWLGPITLILLFPYLFYANLAYIIGVILSFIAAFSSLNQANEQIWSGIIGSGMGLVLCVFLVLNSSLTMLSYSKQWLIFFTVIAITQILALIGYFVNQHIVSTFFAWSGAVAFSAMFIISIPNGGLIIPFYFLLILILSVRGSFELTFKNSLID